MGDLCEILIVEDDAPVSRAIARAFAGYRVSFASSVASASSFAESSMLLGATIDLNLPDGSGFTVVEELRRRLPELPIIVLTGSIERFDVNEAQQVGAEFVCKPDFGPGLREFISRRVRPSAHKAGYIQSARLSRREKEILDLALQRLCNKEIAARLSVSSNTLKSQIRSLLAKTGKATLNDLAESLVGRGPARRRRG